MAPLTGLNPLGPPFPFGAAAADPGPAPLPWGSAPHGCGPVIWAGPSWAGQAGAAADAPAGSPSMKPSSVPTSEVGISAIAVVPP